MKQEEMRLEDLSRNFPQMPAQMREMVEREVQKQIAAAPAAGRKRHIVKKSLVAALAAALLLGTTVFAGVVYRMRSEQVGKYAVKTKIEEIKMEEIETEGTGAAEADDSAFSAEYPQDALEIQDIRMEVSYLPDGMVEVEEGKYCYTNALHEGGVSIVFYQMDTGDDQFEILTTNVKEMEEIRINGYDGIYCEQYVTGSGEISFNQRVYVAYTDLHYVMEMAVASDVSKEEAFKIAEGVHLQPVTDGNTQDAVHAFKWSESMAARDEQVVEWDTEASIPKSAMENTHAVGEAFAAMHVGSPEEDWLGLGNVEIRVTDVQVSDNISLLDLSAMDSDYREELQKEVGQDGGLLPVRIDYIRYGDGINTLDEIVDSREVLQKLVYVTVEYTNTGAEELSEVLFSGNLMKIGEENGQMKLYRGKASDGIEAWDDAVPTGAAYYQELWYYDVHGGEQRNNYITHLGAGETATVHMAWLVPEEELGYLYLDLCTFGSAYEFREESLDIGYVDIRQ